MFLAGYQPMDDSHLVVFVSAKQIQMSHLTSERELSAIHVISDGDHIQMRPHTIRCPQLVMSFRAA
uniref:Transcriptional regulator n=1 Tax=Heterorhabditis bacteriophora TaxID=37862 RepID=A0A1I7WTX6_HETBA